MKGKRVANVSDFYDVQADHSRVKSELVARYLPAWANKVGRYEEDLYYLDLFSGRGIYRDSNRSTPLLILDQIEKYPWLAEKLHIHFYEGNPEYRSVLKEVVQQHPVFSKLVREPKFEDIMIDANFAAKIAGQIYPCTYSFIDPFGFKDISIELIDVISRQWGSDSIFNLSISGLVRNIRNTANQATVERFFGRDSYSMIMRTLNETENVGVLSQVIFGEIENALKSKRDYRVLKICTQFDTTAGENYYLVFLSKHELGFKIMRDMMIKRSAKDGDNLPRYIIETAPSTEKEQYELSLPEQGKLLIDLSKKLHRDFVDQKLTMENLFVECLKLSYPYQDAHIRKAISVLRKQGLVEILDTSGRISSSNIRNADTVVFQYKKR